MLPKKPSKLIRLALSDLKKVEKQTDTYRIDMGSWHIGTAPYPEYTKGKTQKCAVCFAGSVIANTLHESSENTVDVYDFPGETQKKLFALDAFRRGEVKEGLQELGLVNEWNPLWSQDYPEGVPLTVKVPDYSKRNSPKFHLAMKKLADTFEEAGL